MIMVNIHEAKAKLSEFVEAAARGESVVICKRNHPVAELRAVEQKRREPRPMGLGKGTVTIPSSFFDPMPDEWLDDFERAPIYPEPTRKPSRVAEESPPYGDPEPPQKK